MFNVACHCFQVGYTGAWGKYIETLAVAKRLPLVDLFNHAEDATLFVGLSWAAFCHQEHPGGGKETEGCLDASMPCCRMFNWSILLAGSTLLRRKQSWAQAWRPDQASLQEDIQQKQQELRQLWGSTRRGARRWSSPASMSSCSVMMLWPS